MIAGAALLLLGAGIYFAARFNVPLGRLTGDIRVEGEGFSFYFPLTSSLLISLLLTLLLNVVSKLLRK